MPRLRSKAGFKSQNVRLTLREGQHSYQFLVFLHYPQTTTPRKKPLCTVLYPSSHEYGTPVRCHVRGREGRTPLAAFPNIDSLKARQEKVKERMPWDWRPNGVRGEANNSPCLTQLPKGSGHRRETVKLLLNTQVDRSTIK